MGVGDSRVGQPERDSHQDDVYQNDGDGDASAAGNSSKGSRRVAFGQLAGGLRLRPTAAGHPGVHRDTEPRVVLGNKSSYRVSYWVIEENKETNLGDQAHRERLVRSMKRYLNATNHHHAGGGRASALLPTRPTAVGQREMNAEKEKYQKGQEEHGGEEEEDGDAEEGVYFLTRDHRMQPRSGTQATKVAFPVGCTEMRVCAFFEDNAKQQQQWHVFQDRQISTGLFRKVFTLTASDADIAPYAN